MCTRNTYIRACVWAYVADERRKKIISQRLQQKKKKWKKIPTTPSNYIPLPSAHCFLFGVNGFRVRRTQYTYILFICIMYVCVVYTFIYIPGAPVAETVRDSGDGEKKWERQREWALSWSRRLHSEQYTHAYIYVQV